MSGIQHQRIVTLVELSCGECGIAFAVDARVQARWHNDGNTFYCPNGHPRCYRETEAAKLKKQLEAKQKELELSQRATEFAKKNAAAEREAREHTERQLRARKGINTRLRNRIKHGVCPCCNRTFQNLSRHMSTQHPTFNKDDGVE